MRYDALDEPLFFPKAQKIQRDSGIIERPCDAMGALLISRDYPLDLPFLRPWFPHGVYLLDLSSFTDGWKFLTSWTTLFLFCADKEVEDISSLKCCSIFNI